MMKRAELSEADKKQAKAVVEEKEKAADEAIEKFEEAKKATEGKGKTDATTKDDEESTGRRGGKGDITNTKESKKGKPDDKNGARKKETQQELEVAEADLKAAREAAKAAQNNPELSEADKKQAQAVVEEKEKAADEAIEKFEEAKKATEEKGKTDGTTKDDGESTGRRGGKGEITNKNESKKGKPGDKNGTRKKETQQELEVAEAGKERSQTKMRARKESRVTRT